MMKNLTLCNLAEAAGGTLFHGDKAAGKEAEGIVIDSRKVERDFVFIAVRGERTDGHAYIAQVMEKGALAVICEREPENIKVPYILVKDSLKALKDIAEFYREQLNIKVIGITGSVGKTSTKEFIAAVLCEKYNILRTEGNYNNEVGLPLTVLQIREEHETAVLEMGISDFREMHRLSKIAKPDICVLTNIGQCHLENLKSREGILKAKTEIFDYMNKDGYVCINGDDDMLNTIDIVKGRKPFRFGFKKENDVYADAVISRGLFGSSAEVHMEDMIFDIEIPLPGEHMVYNALAASCVGNLLGLSAEEIGRGIKKVSPVSGRSNILRLSDKVVIDDCYNANPVSMCTALDLLAAANTRKVAVLGDMFELGKKEKELHEEVGAYAVLKNIDVIICIGELSKYMFDKAQMDRKKKRKSNENLYYFINKDAFMKKTADILKPDDTILVKASHGMAFDTIVENLKEDTAEVIRDE